MKKIKVTQIKSSIGKVKRQKDTLRALGLRKPHHSVVHEATPQILGMINKVHHLVKTEEIND